MALVVETGAGLSTAESYLSEAALIAYQTAHGMTEPAGTTQTLREVALRKATQYLDGAFYDRWVGLRKTRDQRLEWPREWAYDMSGFQVPANDVPRELEDACAELAFRALSNTLEPDVASTDAGVSAESVKVGSIETSTTRATGDPGSPIYRMAEYILAPLLTGSRGQSELLRA